MTGELPSPDRKAHTLEWSREMASLHALGVLSPEEALSFEAHLAEGCPVCAGEWAAFQDVLAEMGKASASPVAPPSGIRDRLMEKVSAGGASWDASSDRPPPGKPREDVQVWKKWGRPPGESGGPLHILRAGDEGFEPTAAPGVFAKPLHVDRERHYVTMLVRMEPGSSYPSHVHAGAEECYVLSGDLRVGEEVLKSGDYQCAAAGSLHGIQSTERGCLLLIISSQDDELR